MFFYGYKISMKNLFYNRFFILSLVCLLGTFCLFCNTACNLFEDSEEVEFTLPENAEWKICTSCGSEFVTKGRSFSVRFAKNEPAALVAYRMNSFETAGAIYPFNARLTVQNAFAAQVLYSLALSSSNSDKEKRYYLSTFNWKRFEEECALIGKDIWKVNKEDVMKKIADGTFKKTDLKIEK